MEYFLHSTRGRSGRWLRCVGRPELVRQSLRVRSAALSMSSRGSLLLLNAVHVLGVADASAYTGDEEDFVQHCGSNYALRS